MRADATQGSSEGPPPMARASGPGTPEVWTRRAERSQPTPRAQAVAAAPAAPEAAQLARGLRAPVLGAEPRELGLRGAERSHRGGALGEQAGLAGARLAAQRDEARPAAGRRVDRAGENGE